MKEGMWYKVINPANAPNYPGGQRVPLTEGDFWLLSRDDGSSIPEFSPVEGEWSYLQKDRFDPTPYIRKADGRFVPEKENTMIEGKWYKCIESGSGVEAGKYYQCIDNSHPRLANMGVRSGYVLKTRFDPTPHDRTVFPNAPDLIERVRRIDPAAAEWLEFGDHSRLAFCLSTKDLGGVFVWGTSPQGDSYWRKINNALEEEETPVTETFLKGERVEVRDDEDDDWEPATFLCMDEESEFPYVAKPYGVADGFKFCRRPAKRPRIEPGTPIEVWDDPRDKPCLERFGGWHDDYGMLFTDADGCFWKHCRVLVPNGVEV